MTDRTRVLLYHRASAAAIDELAAAYHAISAGLRGTPGLLANELLRSTTDPEAFVVVSEWESLAAFQRWQDLPDHRQTTAPLRPYRDMTLPRPFAVYTVVAAYHTRSADDSRGGDP